VAEASAAWIASGDKEGSVCMSSHAEPEAMAGRIIYGISQMTIGSRAADGFTDLDGSQPDPWRYLVETDNGADVADRR
jgi:hypothetical protein